VDVFFETRCTYEKRKETRKGGNCDALQLEAARHRPSCSDCNSDIAFGATPIIFLSRTDVLATDGYLSVFWPYFHCACAETATSELPVKILVLTLDSVTQIF